MNIRESGEDYLETILMLCSEHGSARSVDIAARLGVSKPSVSFAMKKMRENGYILMGDDNRITLTPNGEAIARRVLERHDLLCAMLMHLGVSEETARADACKIEHDLSDETFEAIRRHLNTYAN